MKNIEIKERTNKNTELMQLVESYYGDVLIAAYHQRGITIEGIIDIIIEMGKCICDKTVEFFYKINDSERSDQIRQVAFVHMQKMVAM